MKGGAVLGALSLLLAVGVVVDDPARAEIVTNGSTIEFRGNVRPGDLPRTVTIHELGFADAASADPVCSPDDFAHFLCRTQYQQAAPPIVPITEEQALTGFSRQTSYQHANGDLVLTFTDLLPVNKDGADLAVFEGFAQNGFAIKVRTLDGTEYGFVDIPSQPFIQITGFDPTGQNWGPCALERPLTPCQLAGLLLVYQIDLDLLQVPAGAAVKDVIIRRRQSPDPFLPFATLPHLVMVGAINGDFTGPGPRPDPGSIADMIHNGFFDFGLDGWTVSGPGAATVVQTLTGPGAQIETDGAPTSLSQVVATPNMSFMINFDYRFLTDAGSLDVLLAGKVIDTLPAQQAFTFQRRQILVNDIDLMGLSSAELVFRVNPGSIAGVILGTIESPQFELKDSSALLTGRASNGGSSVSVVTDTRGGNVCWGANGAYDCTVDTELVPPTDEASQARSFARAFLPFGGAGGGVGVGVLTFAQSLSSASTQAEATARTQVNARYTIVGFSTGRPVPLDYSVGVQGTVTISGDFTATDAVDLTYSIGGGLTTPRATLLANRFAGTLHFDTTGVSLEGDFASGSTCFDPPSAPVGPPFEQVDPVTGKLVRVYEVDLRACVLAALFSEVGGQTVPSLDVSLVTTVTPGFDGYVIADFARTATSEVSTTVPDVQFVLADAPPTNQPPMASAGPDQTVAAGPSCSAPVGLDGSGSSDPDGDLLTYAWTGPFGTATGVSPTVTLERGTHTIQLTVADGKGGTATDEVVVTVEDRTPPVVGALTVTPNVLWPPDHAMVPVATSLSATDNCGTTVVSLSSITMNEGDETDTFDPSYDSTTGDGHTVSDIQVDGAGNISLRAERSGAGGGRVYTIRYVLTDGTGNSTGASATVSVPHDQKR
jgi:hypothetical protein